VKVALRQGNKYKQTQTNKRRIRHAGKYAI